MPGDVPDARPVEVNDVDGNWICPECSDEGIEDGCPVCGGEPVDLDALPSLEEHASTHPEVPSADTAHRGYVLNPHESGAWICSDCRALIRP